MDNNLSKMPKDVAEKFVKNTLALSGIETLTRVLELDYKEMVINAFPWEKSPEGSDYWDRVFDRKFEYVPEYVTITLPAFQAAYLEVATHSLRYSLSNFCGNQDEIFDLEVLSALMKYEVSIKIPKEKVDSFTSIHGVDFPEFK